MAAARELEAVLNSIRRACRDAIDDNTGAVNVDVIREEIPRLVKWISDFENHYIGEAKKRPKRESTILEKGKELAEQAWKCCETLHELDIEAGGPEPVLVRWEQLPSGVAKGDIRSATITELAALVDAFKLYRRDYLQE